MGIVWWIGGMVGIYQSRKGQRTVMPALVILFTGYVMSSHQQSLEISEQIHRSFGYVLMGASIARIIEISFIKDKVITPFHHLCPYVSYKFFFFWYDNDNLTCSNIYDVSISY